MKHILKSSLKSLQNLPLLLVAMLLSILLLSACGKKTDDAQAEGTPETEATQTEATKGEFTGTTWEAKAPIGDETMTMTFVSDTELTMLVGGEIEANTYSYNAPILTVKTADGTEIPLTVDGDKIILKVDTEEVIFYKK